MSSTRTNQLSALLGSLVLLLASGLACTRGDGQATASAPTVPGLLNRIEVTGTLHAGYGVYPPYTAEDPNTRAVSGFSVAIVEAVARELKVSVTWHRLNWNTMAADLKRGEFDLIADPIFQTIPRAREFAFTTPYAYFADGSAVVRKGDTRFRTFDDLNRSGLTIAVGQGWASEAIVRNFLPAATVRPIQTTTDLLQVFNEVLAGRADVAVADAADALRYAEEHRDEVEVLFADTPPVRVPAGFALRPDDREGAEFLNVALRYLRAIGTIDALAKEYRVDVKEP